MHPNHARLSPANYGAKAELQDALIERLSGNERKNEKSLPRLSRLLLDKIVEDLSRTAWLDVMRHNVSDRQKMLPVYALLSRIRPFLQEPVL